MKGEELYESGGVVDINKLDKALYSFTIREGGNIEVEWYKPLTKNQKASCECEFFKIGKSCRHAVAALIAYKAEFAKSTTEEPLEELAGKKFSALNINAILNNLTKDDLRTFVKAYATNDKKFSTAFKVHFARKVDLYDNEKKYKSILDSIIRPVSSDKNPFKAADVRSIINVTEEFMSQADDTMALGQFYEAFLLLKTSIVKLCYTYQHAKHYHEELELKIISGHQRLKDIIVNNESPDLKKNIVDYLNELCHLSYYQFFSLSDNALFILNALNALPEEVDELIALQIKRKNHEQQQMLVLWAMKMYFTFHRDKNFYLESKHYSLLDKIADILFVNQLFEELKAFTIYHKRNVREAHLLSLQATFIAHPKKFISEATSEFLETKDLRIIELVKQKVVDSDFAKYISILAKSSNKLKSNSQFFINYLYKVEAYEDLLSFLQEKKDFRFLMQYDEVLLKLYSDDITKLYEIMVEEFLTQHVGMQSHTFIDELFIHFNKIKAQKLANKIGLMIELKFPHRTRLDDHLS